jgi:hypothetical protein
MSIIVENNIKINLKAMENHEYFKANYMEANIQRFLRIFTDFNLYVYVKNNYYDKKYNAETCKKIKENIYKYLKDRKVLNLKKTKTEIRYDYLYTTIKCTITSSAGTITTTCYREIKK